LYIEIAFARPNAVQLNRIRSKNMGEIAEDLMVGRSCSGCGIYFNGEHSSPVLCKRCWESWKPHERKQARVQKATLPELGDDPGMDDRGSDMSKSA
jgi:hypothetical protein